MRALTRATVVSMLLLASFPQAQGADAPKPPKVGAPTLDEGCAVGTPGCDNLPPSFGGSLQRGPIATTAESAGVTKQQAQQLSAADAAGNVEAVATNMFAPPPPAGGPIESPSAAQMAANMGGELGAQRGAELGAGGPVGTQTGAAIGQQVGSLAASATAGVAQAPGVSAEFVKAFATAFTLAVGLSIGSQAAGSAGAAVGVGAGLFVVNTMTGS